MCLKEESLREKHLFGVLWPHAASSGSDEASKEDKGLREQTEPQQRWCDSQTACSRASFSEKSPRTTQLYEGMGGCSSTTLHLPAVRKQTQLCGTGSCSFHKTCTTSPETQTIINMLGALQPLFWV